MRRVGIAVLIIAVVLAAPAMAASKSTYACTGDLGGDPVTGLTPQVIDSDLDVPAGATCAIYDSEVTGNVTVEGTLIALGDTFDRNVTMVGGSGGFPNPVLSHGLAESRILGNLTIITSADVELSVTVEKTLILVGAHSADFTFASVGRNVWVVGSGDVLFWDIGTPDEPGIGGNLILAGNGTVTIGNTAIGGTLACIANNPAPLLEPQVTFRAARGQCSPGTMTRTGL